jgi:hypothetical protein
MPRKRKGLLVGDGMNANLLKEFIDLSYKGNTSIHPEGYAIDAPLSDSRVKVYTKNGSNDKDVVVTHRGSVGLDDWWDNAKYMTTGKVKGTKTYNLHRERHKKAIDKYGASNIIAIGHSRAGLYLQELQKEFPIKENITYNKASGFTDIGRQNDPNQTDVRVGNDIVSLLAPTQKNPNAIVKIDNTKNALDFNKAHQTGEIDKLGTTFIGKKNEMEGSGAIKRGRGRPKKVGCGFNKKQLTKIILDKNKVIADLEETAYGGMIHPEAEDVFDTFEGRIKRKVTKPKKVSKKNLKQQEGYDDEFDTITKRRQDEEIEELMRRGTQRREAQRQDDEAERRRYDEANNLIWDIIRPYNLQRGTENMRNFWLMIEMIREENDIVEVPTSYVKRFVESIVNEGDDSRFDVMSFNLNPRDDSRGDDDTEPTIGSGIHNQYSYLDNIINNDTTSQNLIIRSYKSNPKYIQSLVD